MKKTYHFIIVAFVTLGLWSCESEAIEVNKSCTYNATIKDLSGLDGCGYLFMLENGDYLEPVWRWGFCGTPPLPEGATEDPLWDFQFEDGKKLRLGFEYTNNYGSSCMKGKTVIITCLETIDDDSPEL
ncbi:hypothetical protein [Fulvivirga imtechensis]|nr:hypothetical protein [Fulvivirga imtechensis]